MKIVIAPDSFKENLTAQKVAEAIKRGFQQSIADVDCLLCPVGDGGEGTVDAIRHSLDLEEKWIQVTGPFGQRTTMPYFQKGQQALFEVADLVGLGKIPLEKRNPLQIQTCGIGELIRHLIDQGIKDIYIGVGGTASNDGGLGIAAICGSLAEDLPSLPFENIQAAFSILEKSEPLEDSLNNASVYLEHTATNIGRLLSLSKI